MRKPIHRYLAVTTALTLLPALAHAENKFAGLEEITTTARRITENLQTTPVSVTVLTSKILSDLSANNIGEIQAVTPNLQYTSGFGGSSSAANFFIRGIGQIDFLSLYDPGVATFIDGVYLGRTMGGALDTADIERIEVLKGPQGTLFGKNTIGGAINITTSKPDEKLRGYVQGTVGNYGRYDGQFMANVPVSDTFFVKLTGVTRNNDGFQKRRSDGVRLGDDKDVSGSVQARYAPSENLDIILSVDATRRRAHIAAQSATTILPYEEGNFIYDELVPGFIDVTGEDPQDPKYAVSSDPRKIGTSGIRPTDDLDVLGASLVVNYGFGDINFKSISAYREMRSQTGTDFDGTELAYNDQMVDQDQHQYSQEFQLSQQADRYKWVAGLFYFKEKTVQTALNQGIFFYGDTNDLWPTVTDLTTNNFAAYAQGSYSLTDRLSVTAGLRWTYEKKDATFVADNFFGGVVAENKKSWKNFSPRFGVDYQVHDDLMLYASVTRGFKSGSFTGRPIASEEFIPFAPESVWAYEAGFKSEFWNNKVRLNGAAFVTRYQDIQLVISSNDALGNAIFITANAGNLYIKGFELELNARPTEELSFYASLGHADENWTYLSPDTGATEAIRLPMMSRWTAVIGGDYAFPIANFGSLTVGGNYSYRTAHYLDFGEMPNLRQKGYGLLDARIVLEPESGNWQLKFWGKNLTDKSYKTWVQDAAIFGDIHTVSFFGRPREYGVTFRVNL